MIKSRGMVSSFAIAIAIHLGFSIASGCFSIYTMFARNSQATLDSCMEKANDDSDTTMQSCKSGLILIKALMVVIYVLTWLIQLCSFFYHTLI
jgi:flagellar basal body-associated protein FliL